MLSDLLEKLISEIREEAMREEFPLDRGIYDEAGLNPCDPILFAGSMESPLCFFARDLGRDEVNARQPLYGAAGRLVRRGAYRTLFGKAPSAQEEVERVLDKILLTNTVPYKPPGNKAYSAKVRNRFRPFIERFLLTHWRGSWIIPLGTEALEWFSPYDPGLAPFLKDPNRFAATFSISLEARGQTRRFTLAPLPHPSPLNQKYYSLFPEMLERRMKEYLAAAGLSV